VIPKIKSEDNKEYEDTLCDFADWEESQKSDDAAEVRNINHSNGW